jgi:predicted amidohydrolase
LRIGLAVPLVTPSVEENLKRVGVMRERVSLQGAELVLFPEAVLTGLSNCDIPEKDLPLCVAIPGDETEKIASLARDNHIFLAIGLLEKNDGRIYDCALLFSPEGDIIMKYRRMQAQWHGQKADPLVYCEGACVSKVETECGALSFLICGDLFDDSILSMVRIIEPDYVLVPMSR